MIKGRPVMPWARFATRSSIAAIAFSLATGATAQTSSPVNPAPPNSPGISEDVSANPQSGTQVPASQAPSVGGQSQTPADASTDQSSGLQDIVVTAERRESSVQRTPIAISAVGGDALRQSGITDIKGLDQQVPNLTFQQNSGEALIFIRGVGYTAIAPGGETRVALYSDGVYQSRTQAGLLGFYDVDRVEVLRGPQGTLYGRNAIAGTINILSRDPGPTYDGYLSGTLGTYGLVAAEGAIGGPVSSGIEARIAFRTADRGGYGENLNSHDDVNDEHTRSVRLKLKFQPTSNLTFKLSGDYDIKRDHSAGYIYVGPANSSIVPLGLSIPNSSAPSRPQDAAGLGPLQHLSTFGFSGEANWNITPDTIVTLLSGYRHLNSLVENSVDGFTSQLTQHYVTEHSTTFSQEARVAQRFGSFADLIVGGYYFQERNTVLNEAPHKGLVFGPAFGVGNVIDPNTLYEFFATFGRASTDALAAFGQLNVHITHKLELDLGGRYSHEVKRLFEQKQLDLVTPFVQGNPLNATFNPAAGQLGGQDNLRLAASSFDPKVTVSFRPINTLFLYATYSRGFKSGGFNIGGLQDPFQPEKLTNYEAGFKADLLNRHLRINGSIFNYDYKNLQESLVEGQNLVTRNAASARIRGIEAEITGRPTADLTLTLNAAYLDAKFRQFLDTDPVHPERGVQNLAGLTLPDAPKYQVNAGASYAIHTGIGQFTPKAELSYTDTIYFVEFNTPEFTQPKRTLVNLYLNWVSDAGGWSASAYIKNLTNKVYFSNEQASNGLLGFPKLGQYGDPRTAGIILTKKF